MDEEEEGGENESMTWKGSEREVCWAWCVCALLCCVASGSTEDRGTGGVGSEGQKSTLYTGKYKNLSPLNAANTRGKYQKGFYASSCQWAFRVAHFHSERFFFENPMMPLFPARPEAGKTETPITEFT